MSTVPQYDPTARFNNVQELYDNHFRFSIEALPDLGQYCQSVSVPGVASASIARANPFSKIQEVGDHLDFGTFNITFKVDAQLKNYTSLFWWMKGYGFPHSYDEVSDFRAKRQRQLTVARGRPIARDMEKTTAVLYILQPDTEIALMEYHYTDVFPVGLSSLDFTTTSTEVTIIRCTATFALTDFDMFLPNH